MPKKLKHASPSPNPVPDPLPDVPRKYASAHTSDLRVWLLNPILNTKTRILSQPIKYLQVKESDMFAMSNAADVVGVVIPRWFCT